MPFGKFKHRDLREVDTSYLRWLCDNVDLDAYLAWAVRHELDSRDDEEPRRGCRHEEPRRQQPHEDDGPDLRGLVARWHRQLALQFHPDRGGSDRAMQAVNVARDALVELLQSEGLVV